MADSYTSRAPLVKAIRHGRSCGLIRLLLAHGADQSMIKPPLAPAVFDGIFVDGDPRLDHRFLLQTADILLDDNVTINTSGPNEIHTLLIACARQRGAGTLELVRWLLHHGADVNATDEFNAPPFVHAISAQNT